MSCPLQAGNYDAEEGFAQRNQLPTRDSAWDLVWCHERCFKHESDSMRLLLIQLARGGGGQLVCIKKSSRFESWLLQKALVPESRCILLTDWREAKPAMQAIMQVEACKRPLQVVVRCDDWLQAKRAKTWAEHLPADCTNVRVCQGFRQLVNVLNGSTGQLQHAVQRVSSPQGMPGGGQGPAKAHTDKSERDPLAPQPRHPSDRLHTVASRAPAQAQVSSFSPPPAPARPQRPSVALVCPPTQAMRPDSPLNEPDSPPSWLQSPAADLAGNSPCTQPSDFVQSCPWRSSARASATAQARRNVGLAKVLGSEAAKAPEGRPAVSSGISRAPIAVAAQYVTLLQMSMNPAELENLLLEHVPEHYED